MDLKMMIDSLSDIGLTDEQKRTASKLYDLGQNAELIRYLKKCRCGLIDEMHESQRKVDCMDLMIHRLEKNS